jgi:hypothetical protein
MDPDGIFCVFSHLDYVNILACSSVDKQFYDVSKSEVLWKRLCNPEYDITNDYRINYKNYHILNKFMLKYDHNWLNSHKKGVLNWHGVITNLPKEFSSMTNLRSLTLSHGATYSISAISSLTNLSHIDFSFNDLHSFDKAIISLTNLRDLRLMNNRIGSIPWEILRLTNLEIIHLSNNDIKSIPITMRSLTKLRILNLFNNKLESIPKEIYLLTNLDHLNLGRNKIELISGIGSLTKLECLSLCPMMEIPQEIRLLTKLNKLYVSTFQSKLIPQELSHALKIADYYYS